MGNEEPLIKEAESMLIIKRMHNKVDSIKRELSAVFFDAERPLIATEEPSSPLLQELKNLERNIEHILDSIRL